MKIKHKIVEALNRAGIDFLLFFTRERRQILSTDLRHIALGFIGAGLVDMFSQKLINLSKLEAMTLIALGVLMEILAMTIIETEQKNGGDRNE